MHRHSLRATCASFASLVFVVLLSHGGAHVNAQSVDLVATSPDILQGETLTNTIWAPLASNNTNLAGSVEVSTTLEASAAVTKTIPPSGGTITATSASGDRFVVTLPDGALNVTTTVVLTPVASIALMPLGEFVAGVQIAPANLGLWQAATLRIEPATAVTVPNQVSFGWFDAGDDFHLYPLNKDPAVIEFSITRLQGYGVGSTASALASDVADSTQGANTISWTPTDILANIGQRMQPILQQMREDLLANRASSPELIAQLDALLHESWQKAIQPLLQPMTVSCDAAQASAPIALGWLRQIMLLGYEEEFATEGQQISTAVLQALENCISEAAEPCLLMADTAQVAEILGYMRQLALLGAESEINIEELPKCQTINVNMGSDRTKQFAMQPDPETGWNTKADYVFSDGSAAGVLQVNPFGMFDTGASGTVTMLARFGDTWRTLSPSLDRWLCRDKTSERIDELIVDISNVTYAGNATAPPVPFYLHVSKVGCWRWTVEQTYSDQYTENPKLEWTHDTALDTMLEITGTKPLASWDKINKKVNIFFNPLKFQMMPVGTYDYAMNYVVSGTGACQSSLTAHKAPPELYDPVFSGGFTMNIDDSPPNTHDISGGIEITINQPYIGNCASWQNPLQFASVLSTGELSANGRSASGTSNGFLGEQSGVWNASWTYTAQRQ